MVNSVVEKGQFWVAFSVVKKTEFDMIIRVVKKGAVLGGY